MNIEEFERIFRPQHASAGPHTLDSPVRYEVWKSYAIGDPDQYVDLLLETKSEATKTLAAVLGQQALERSGLELSRAAPAVTAGLIAIRLPFAAFVENVIPLTAWRDLTALGQELTVERLAVQLEEAKKASDQGASRTDRWDIVPDELGRRLRGDRQNLLDRFRWFVRLISHIGTGDPDITNRATWLYERFQNSLKPAGRISIDTVSHNRPARGAIQISRGTIKADAAHSLFSLSCEGLGWAVLDSGIDARHPAFRAMDRDGVPYADDRLVDRVKTRMGEKFVERTRIVATYDFANAREEFAGLSVQELKQMRFEQYFNANKIDLFPDPKKYRAPGSDHGTHVAGILAANWKEGATVKMQGICPDLDLWDIRVLDDHGVGDEFGVVAGLRLVETINREAGYLRIHGVNLSLSITHQVANFACGWTPVCNACNDLVDSGVVVVASAGNTGFADPDNLRRSDGTNYRTVSITDPGNADKVITVGSTHASLPHRYGTSYFSARGPTADGRRKPDLLAPGEAITGPIPLIHDERPDYKSYDGTSQAAPHVSGAAALLIARYPELRGQPLEVKKILCDSATDLGREPYFQGYGLVDVLRALQSR
jgi:hypothetical protein